MGQAVAASLVVSGSIAMDGDQFVARARVIRIDTGRLLPEVVAQGPLAQLFAVFGRLAQSIRADATGSLPSAGERLPPTPQVS